MQDFKLIYPKNGAPRSYDIRICPTCNETVVGNLQDFTEHRKTHGTYRIERIEVQAKPTSLERKLPKRRLRKKRRLNRDRTLNELRATIRSLQNTIQQKERALKKIDSEVVELDFYRSRPWRKLRWDVLKDHRKTHGAKCLVCYRMGVPLHVDHIIPRSKARHLELDRSNLQVLCEDCNMGKGNRDQTDFRHEAPGAATQSPKVPVILKKSSLREPLAHVSENGPENL